MDSTLKKILCAPNAQAKLQSCDQLKICPVPLTFGGYKVYFRNAQEIITTRSNPVLTASLIPRACLSGRHGPMLAFS